MKTSNFTEKLENFFSKQNITLLFIVLIGILYIIYGFQLFQVNVSLGEDDSVYILAAKKFLEGREFPTWHGSFYPIFLSFFMKIFGFNLLLFKLINFILVFIQLFILYFALKDRIPNLILLLSLLIISFNAYILVYASQTYSEALYLFLQATVILVFYKLYDKIKDNQPFKKTIIDWLLLGFFMFLLSITRNIGWAILFTVILFFAVEKRWKEIGLSILSMFIFYLPYNLYKIYKWNLKQAGFEGQFSAMFLKNPYNPNMGYETFDGFIKRFLINSQLYLSKHLTNILGFTNTSKTSVIITLLVYLLFFFSLIVIWKKRRELLFILFYIAIAVAGTFISQQTFWDQERLILVYVPLILPVVFTAIYDATIKTKFHWLSPVLIIITLLFGFSQTQKAVKLYNPVRKAVMEGNKYFGLTPDWQNYLRMVEYAAKTLPDTVKIACRKPGIAFIYSGGREFIGLYKFLPENIDSAIVNSKRLAKRLNRIPFAIKFTNSNQGVKKLYDFYPFYEYFYVVINNYATHSDYTIFIIPDNIKQQMELLAQKNKIQYFTDLDSLRKQIIIQSKSDYAAYPDTLLKYFYDKGIQYVIMGNLRKVQTDPSQGIITTIQRYLSFIEFKFPGTFHLIKQIGQSEPAYLFQVNYNSNPQLTKFLYNNKNQKQKK